MINTTTVEGTVCWITSNRRDFEPHLKGFRQRGERYRIFERVVRAGKETAVVYVMLINQEARPRYRYGVCPRCSRPKPYEGAAFCGAVCAAHEGAQ